MIPLPTQITGAKFLASNAKALLADEPRVGKTGAAILGADYILAQSILIVTTASGRGVWRRAMGVWSDLNRSVCVVGIDKNTDADVLICSWGALTQAASIGAILARNFDLVILDEDHYAKNITAARTQAVYGKFYNDGGNVMTASAVTSRSERVWHLSGTPAPHDPSDFYPRLRSSAPERLKANPLKGWPDVTKYNDFLHRYCVVRMKQISRFNRIPIVIGGKNEEELKERISGFMLKRTQKDVGIRPPDYDVMPLVASPSLIRKLEKDIDKSAILEAIKDGTTRELDQELGALRRMTGEIKAPLIIDAVKEEFNCGLDKIVIAYWHKNVGDALQDGLKDFNPLRIDGSTPANDRSAFEVLFRETETHKVMLAQIAAAGEAIDLSAAAVLWFAESSFTPSQMKQMSLRITNHTQTRNASVRVCTLSGSIDEAMQMSVMRLWAAIRKVIE